MSPTGRDVLLFSGQGSNQHLANPQTVQGLLDLLNQENTQIFEGFLKSCRDAFHVEFAHAAPHEQRLLGHDLLQALDEPECLFIPPQQFQSHPIIETLSLYINQILELMLFQTHQNGHRVVEVAGVCTGTLPATLAGCFTSFVSDDFVAAAVQGFRLAFWIGLRATENAITTEVLGDIEATCVLGIFGSTLEVVQEILQSHPHGKHAQISAVFSDNNISISGPSTALHHIRATVAEMAVQSRWAHVHAIYHGGPDMESTLQATIADSERRNIAFPSWDSLHVPLRSVSTGIRMDSKTQINSMSLLETTLRSIFIDRVDWKSAADCLYNFHRTILERDSAAKTRVIGIGPGSKALGHSTKVLCSHPRLERIDSWSEHISHAANDDIAIVGLSVNYPGANGVDQLWELLQSGRSMVSEIPSSRFTMPQSSPSDSKRAKFTAKYGNFLQNPFDFDATYFNISPREAKSIDPQQRLLLHAALEALQDAGYKPDSTPTFQTETFGVYAGVATGDYVDNLRNDVDVYYSPGTLRAFLSGRISYAFKFKGPSMVIDTACSSSTVALYEACKALRSGDCTAALAMGVNTMTSPDMYSGLGRAHFLSPTGQCKPFDEGADGYCRAEGCGGVVIKKLSDAIAEGDHIYGVIRGIGVNQCGTAKSITHPDSSTQAALMKTVLHAARVSPRSISVVEAHGTGTQAGDHAECSSLRSVFGLRPPTNPLYLGSVKGSFGHAEAASGIAGLAKLLTMMQKKQIPPQSSHNTLNPALKNLVDGSFHISRQLQDWNRAPGQAPRRALLNNFGAAGSNAALILEEYIPPRSNISITLAAEKSRSHQLLTVTAKTAKALESLKASYASYLQHNPSISLEDFCYSANSRRQEHFPHRFLTIATDRTDIIRRLTEPQQPSSVKDLQESKRQKKTIFVFSGQGGAHAGMGADLLATSPDFVSTVHKFDKVLHQHGFAAVAPFLTCASDPANTLNAEETLVVSQCALFVLEFGLASLWLSWGISPDLIMGHSIGEYAAFAIAKVIDPIAALLLVAKRARLMARQCKTQSTGMLACRMSAAAVSDILSTGEDKFSGLSVACMNSAQDLVLAGSLTSLDAFAGHCKTQGVKHKLLQVPFGFHSQAMDPILDDLSKITSETLMATPSVTLGSSLYGRVFSAEEKPGSNYFVDHARETVRFADLATDVANQFSAEDLTILEIGPSPSTEPMFKSAFANNSYSFVASLKPSQPSWAILTQAMQSLFFRNYSLNWRAVYRGVPVIFQQSLPKYPLDKFPYFVPFQAPVTKTLNATDTPAADSKLSKYAFLSKVAPAGSSEDTNTFTTDSQQIRSFVKAHCVGGVPLCPASVYLEVVLQAAAHQNATGTGIGISVFDDVVFEHPYVFSEESSVQTTSLQTRMGSVGADRVVQFTSSSGADMVHCTGSVRCLTKPSQNTTDLFRRKMLQVERLKQSLDTEPTALMQKFSPRTIYNLIFPRVVKYSDPFLTLQNLTLSGSGLDGKGVFRLSSLDAGSNGNYVTSPAFVDTLLHAAGFIANTHVTPDIACICVSIEQAVVCCDPSKLYDQDLRLYCTVGDLDHSFIADAYAIGPDGGMLAYVSGMCFKKIRLKSFEAHLSRAIGRSSGRKATATTPAAHRHSAKTTQSQRPTSKSPKVVVEDTLSDQEDNTTLCILAQVCGLDQEPAMDHTLEQLGVDSLLMIELMELLQQEFSNFSFDSNYLETCRTVGDLMNLTAKAAGGRNETRVPSLVHTRTPSPTASEEYISTPPESRNDHAEAIRSIFIDVCGLDPEEGRDQALSLLGVDSLMSIELLEELSDRLGIKVDMKDYNISDLTYQQLELLCGQNEGLPKSSQDYSRIEPTALQTANSFAVSEKLTSKANETVENCVKLLQSSNAGSPSLYMFHDGSGLCSMYSKLHNIDQQLYGVYSLDSPSSSPRDFSHETMEDLASWYIKHANLLRQSQEVILGGWSFGGVLAFEVSRQLARHGKPVKGLILVDSPVPINHQALPEPIVSYILAKGDSPTTSRVVQEARARVRDQFLSHAAMLQKYSPAPMQGNSIPCVFVRCIQTMDTERLCGTSYPWLNDAVANKASILQWEKLLGHSIPVLDVDCNHFGAFDASAIEAVSKQLQKACRLLQ